MEGGNSMSIFQNNGDEDEVANTQVERPIDRDKSKKQKRIAKGETSNFQKVDPEVIKQMTETRLVMQKMLDAKERRADFERLEKLLEMNMEGKSERVIKFYNEEIDRLLQKYGNQSASAPLYSTCNLSAGTESDVGAWNLDDKDKSN